MAEKKGKKDKPQMFSYVVKPDESLKEALEEITAIHPDVTFKEVIGDPVEINKILETSNMSTDDLLKTGKSSEKKKDSNLVKIILDRMCEK